MRVHFFLIAVSLGVSSNLQSQAAPRAEAEERIPTRTTRVIYPPATPGTNGYAGGAGVDVNYKFNSCGDLVIALGLRPATLSDGGAYQYDGRNYVLAGELATIPLPRVTAVHFSSMVYRAGASIGSIAATAYQSYQAGCIGGISERIGPMNDFLPPTRTSEEVDELLASLTLPALVTASEPLRNLDLEAAIENQLAAERAEHEQRQDPAPAEVPAEADDHADGDRERDRGQHAESETEPAERGSREQSAPAHGVRVEEPQRPKDRGREEERREEAPAQNGADPVNADSAPAGADEDGSGSPQGLPILMRGGENACSREVTTSNRLRRVCSSRNIYFTNGFDHPVKVDVCWTNRSGTRLTKRVWVRPGKQESLYIGDGNWQSDLELLLDRTRDGDTYVSSGCNPT